MYVRVQYTLRLSNAGLAYVATELYFYNLNKRHVLLKQFGGGGGINLIQLAIDAMYGVF